MTDEFDRAAAEEKLTAAGAVKDAKGGWWTLPFTDDDGQPVRANGVKAAVQALDRGGAPATIAAANDDSDDEPDDGRLKPGTPTQPEKAGLTASELAPFSPPAEGDQPAAREHTGPSLTGADIKKGIGVPTEPDRGGLNTIERNLSGAK